MMRWWLDRGVDGFRMDVINLILPKHPSSPTHKIARAASTRTAWSSTSPARASTSSCRRMHREVFAGRDGLLTVGETPGVTLENARRYSDPANAEVDMVFGFEHVGLDHGATKWDVHPLRLTDLKRSFGRWQRGARRARLEQPLLEQPRPAADRLSLRRRPRVSGALGQAARHRAASASRDAVRLPGRGARDDERPVRAIDDFHDLESLNHYAERVAAGADPAEVLGPMRAMSRDNARTPMQWDASPHAGFTAGTPWIAVNPNHDEINAAAAVADPDSVFHPLPAADRACATPEPAVAYGDFTMLLEDDERVYAFTREHEGTELLVVANFSGDTVGYDIPGWDGAELLLGNCAVVGRGAAAVGGAGLQAEQHALGGRELLNRAVRAVGVGRQHQRAGQPESGAGTAPKFTGGAGTRRRAARPARARRRRRSACAPDCSAGSSRRSARSRPVSDSVERGSPDCASTASRSASGTTAATARRR